MSVHSIKPSVVGFFLTHYPSLTLIAVVMMVGGLIAMIISEIASPFFIIGVIIEIITLVIIGIPLAYSIIHCRETTLSFDEDEVMYETGIFHRKKTKIPMHQITDTQITQKFLQRLLGVATISINTPGKAEYEIIADSLPVRQAHQFHDELYRRIVAVRHKTETKIPSKVL